MLPSVSARRGVMPGVAWGAGAVPEGGLVSRDAQFDHPALVLALQVAVPLEIAKVTEASTELMVADQNRARVATSQMRRVMTRIGQIYDSGREVSDAETA